MRINKRLFQTKTAEDNDILSYHFKEQCRIQRRINATMPHLKSLHDRPSVRVKANGAIVLNRHNNTSIPSDWVSSLDESDDDDNNPHDHALDTPNSAYSALSSSSTVSSTQSFLCATPLRNRVSNPAISPILPLPEIDCHVLPGMSRSSSLPTFPQLSPPPPSVSLSLSSSSSSSYSGYHYPYEKKLDILLKEMEDIQQEGAGMKKNYLLLERRNKLLERELEQRDQLIYSLQSKIQSLLNAA